MKHKYVIGAVVAALLLAAFLYLYGGSQVPNGQPAMRNLTAANTREFESEFNAANGDVRVLLLLSPT
jgi:hypothetical protein